MKKYITLCCAVSALTLLGGCANYQAKLATFTAQVVATNQAIADISKSLAQNCSQLESSAIALSSLVSLFNSNPKATGGLAAANAALTVYCQAPPTDIASTIAAVAAEAAAAKAAYKAAQKS